MYGDFPLKDQASQVIINLIVGHKPTLCLVKDTLLQCYKSDNVYLALKRA